jgi:hypothetical protein
MDFRSYLKVRLLLNFFRLRSLLQKSKVEVTKNDPVEEMKSVVTKIKKAA